MHLRTSRLTHEERCRDLIKFWQSCCLTITSNSSTPCNRRLLEPIGDVPPGEFDQAPYQQQVTHAMAA